MSQPDLDTPSIQEQFEAFHRRHPDVFELFRRYAWDLRHAGRKRFGAKAIMERIRWDRMTSSAGDPAEVAKIPNNYTSRYVRLLIEQDGSFAGFFRLARLRAR